MLGAALPAVACRQAKQDNENKQALLPAVIAPAMAAPAQPAPKPKKTTARVVVAVTEEGFVPAQIQAKVGVPITLAVTRKVEKTCATEILFEGRKDKTDLPLNKTVEVTYTPAASGAIKFGCAMGMMVGGVLNVGP
jgi:plastocyanin domain-containing protein